VNATCILVEGKDDIAFVRRLVDKERQNAGLGSLRWKVLNENDKVIIGSSEWVGNCAVTFPTQVVAIMEVRGIYKIEKALDIEPIYGLVSIGNKEYPVEKYVCIFDADALTNFLGNSVPYGGFNARDSYVRQKMSASGKAFDVFLLADNASDTTLEDLVANMIDSKYQFLVRRNWVDYRVGVATDLMGNTGELALGYSKKCEVSQFAAILDKSVAKDLYWISALWNDRIWDWNASCLNPLKSFIRAQVPVLFR